MPFKPLAATQPPPEPPRDVVGADIRARHAHAKAQHEDAAFTLRLAAVAYGQKLGDRTSEPVQALNRAAYAYGATVDLLAVRLKQLRCDQDGQHEFGPVQLRVHQRCRHCDYDYVWPRKMVV